MRTFSETIYLSNLNASLKLNCNGNETIQYIHMAQTEGLFSDFV